MAVSREFDIGAQLSTAVQLHQAGELQKAKSIYEHILQVHPWHADALHLLGLMAHQIGNHGAAIALIDKAIAIKPDNALFFNHRGLAFYALHENQKAVESYAQALTLNPRFAPAYVNRGNALDALGQHQEAIASYDSAIQFDPQSIHAYLNKAVMLEKTGEPGMAISTCDLALQVNPEFADAHCLKGISLLSLGKLNDAIQAFDRALKLNPVLVQALCNRGIAFQRLYKYQQSLDDFNRCIELEPQNSNLFFNRGSLLFQNGDISGALESYESAIILDPNNAEAQFNKSLVYLSQKNFQKGWELYRWRFVRPKEPQAMLHTSLEMWDSENIGHRRVLIWAEQGVGDQVLFATMLNDAKRKIPELTVLLDPRLIPLFERSFPNIHFLPINSPLKNDDFDAQLPMMSLGSTFRKTNSDFLPIGDQYLYAERNHADFLRKKLAVESNILCGIFWRSRSNKNEYRKSLELKDLLPILQIPGIKFVNLQYGDTRDECKVFRDETGIEILSCDSVDNFKDLDGHAALIQACDFVVGCSNTSAHFAGALGKKTYLALAHGHGTFWYWANEVEGHSLWYPSIKIHRQQQPGNWVKPIEAIRSDILANTQGVVFSVS